MDKLSDRAMSQKIANYWIDNLYRQRNTGRVIELANWPAIPIRDYLKFWIRIKKDL